MNEQKNNDFPRHLGDSPAVETAPPKVERPSLYRVVLLNDDYTPMEFVVQMLQKLFGYGREKATRIMLEVHMKGRGVCGVFAFEIAETRAAQVLEYARRHEHPLACVVEKA
ncbi:ATP-dependent Clp protease adapter ClpS [Candidatus Foliamicus sp.]